MVNRPAQDFERVVRDAMDRADLSLSALARGSGIERGRWYAWFRGENMPQPRTLTRAAKVLKVDVTELTAPWGGMAAPEVVTDALVAAINGLTAAVVALARREGAPADPHAARMLELAARVIDPARNAEVPASQPSASGKPARLG